MDGNATGNAKDGGGILKRGSTGDSKMSGASDRGNSKDAGAALKRGATGESFNYSSESSASARGHSKDGHIKFGPQPSDASQISDASRDNSSEYSGGIQDLLDNTCAKSLVDITGGDTGRSSERRSIDSKNRTLIDILELQEIKIGAAKSKNLRNVLRHLFGITSVRIGSMMKGNTRGRVKRWVNSNAFTGFFLVLTIYALFGPDLVILHGHPDNDIHFGIFNTIVLGLFLVELSLLTYVTDGYACTGQFWLDLFAAISLLGDTYFVQELLASDAVVAGRGSKIARMARMASRSSRLSRLSRISRVVRITKLIPHVQRCLSTGKREVSEMILRKRLWRIFKFLGGDINSSIAEGDMVFCRAALMREFLIQRPDYANKFTKESAGQQKYLGGLIRRGTSEEEREVEAQADLDKARSGGEQLGFDQFFKDFLDNVSGRQLKLFCLAEIEYGGSAWTITQKLTERTAIKVCLGVICLLVILPLLEPDVVDRQAEAGITQLDGIARHTDLEYDYICSQLSLFANSNAYTLLYLILNHRTHWDGFRCVDVLAEDHRWPNVIDRVLQVYHTHRDELRAKEMDLICIDESGRLECDPEKTQTVALLNIRTQVAESMLNSIYMTITVIILILLFVSVFNAQTGRISRQFLKPLRILSDDMHAVTLMQVASVDSDMPGEKEDTGEVMDEMLLLQASFNQLRGALRSWSKYVPQGIALRLFSAGVEASIGVSKCCVSIVFCDIINFDDIVQVLTPKELLMLLSEVLNAIMDVLEDNGGTLLEFIGDEVVAVFNTPEPRPNHPRSAVQAAHTMIQKVDELRPWITAVLLECPAVSLRCGVHTADMLVGNIGSHRRMKYGLLGDGINLTARLKGLNSRYQTRCLVSEATLNHAGASIVPFVVRPVDLVVVKGKTVPIRVYECIGQDSGMAPEKGVTGSFKRPSMQSRGIFQAAMKHHVAFEHYLNRRFNDALEEFREVSAMLEDPDLIICGVGVGKDGTRRDEPSRMLIGRCLAYALDPPAADWDGAERLTQKSWAPSAAPEPAKIADHGHGVPLLPPSQASGVDKENLECIPEEAETQIAEDEVMLVEDGEVSPEARLVGKVAAPMPLSNAVGGGKSADADFGITHSMEPVTPRGQGDISCWMQRPNCCAALSDRCVVSSGFSSDDASLFGALPIARRI